MTGFPKGHVFNGPDGQSYVLLDDIYPGKHILADDFKPEGGAPKPKPGVMLEHWLLEKIGERMTLWVL